MIGSEGSGNQGGELLLLSGLAEGKPVAVGQVIRSRLRVVTHFASVLVAIVTSLATVSAETKSATKTVSLFNGKDLTGWHVDVPGDVNCISDGFDRGGRLQDFCRVSPLWRLLAAQTPSLPEGENLNGLPKTAVIQSTSQRDKNLDAKASFIVRDRMPVSLGEPNGHLITDAIYENYRLEVEYRFAAEPGNCDVLVHASTPRALYGMFP